jgi:ADP-ribose pyrophosphatase YjhB (NUDIX family)
VDQRIRVAALVIWEDRLLLAKHQHPTTGKVWWTPPGGRLEGTESILDCAQREMAEETGLTVVADRVVYIQQFVDLEWNHHNLVLFVAAALPPGVAPPGVIIAPPTERYVRESRFLSRAEAAVLPVLPATLQLHFWDDLARGLPAARFLGVDRPSS